MNIKSLLSLLMCFFLSGCTDIPSNKEEYTLAIQAYSNSSVITEAIQKLTPQINSIIKEELGLKPNYDFEFFIPKKGIMANPAARLPAIMPRELIK